MKKLKILFITLVVAGLVGCEDFLVQSPQQSLDLEDVIRDPEGITALVTGMYDGIQDPSISGANYNVIPEVMADNVVWSGSFVTYIEFHERQMTATNLNTVNWWTVSYRTINLANVILEALDIVDDPTLSEAQKNIWRGEALFVRGMLYFELARVYGKPWVLAGGNTPGVPISLTAVKGSAQFENLPRAALAEVYAQAESDIQQAATLLPDVGVRGDRRLTRYAALGYLMRMELVKGNYAAAADYANQIMNSGHFALTPHPNGPFDIEFSPESIFEIIHTPVDNPGVNAGQNAFYGTTEMGGRGDIQISASYVEATGQIITDAQQAVIDAAGFTVSDRRVTEMVTSLTPGTGATMKFPDAVNNADNVLNLRYADVLLTRAEALVELAADLDAVPEEAFDLLNMIRTRAIVVDDGEGGNRNDLIEFGPGDFTTKQELLDAILLERRIEMAFEGDRFYTLHRKGLDIRGLAPDHNRVTFPIPQQELDANPNIVQNPGY